MTEFALQPVRNDISFMKSRSYRALPVSIAAVSLALAAPAYAQQDVTTPKSGDAQADDFHETDEIVVTAPYVERLDILSGTSTVSGEILADKTRAQIGDVLTQLPGVSATSFAPGASRPVLRGFQGNRVAVLTDGIGNIDASNTSADHAVTIDALTTERIEVLRGPAVLLFGGSAVGGAVNVIDKRIPRSVPDEPMHVDALASYSYASNEFAGGASVDVPFGSLSIPMRATAKATICALAAICFRGLRVPKRSILRIGSRHLAI